MNKVELNETGYAFVWMGRVVWHRRLKAIRWALRNLWNALCGYELSLQWDPEKMGDTRNRPTANYYAEHADMSMTSKPTTVNIKSR